MSQVRGEAITPEGRAHVLQGYGGPLISSYHDINYLFLPHEDGALIAPDYVYFGIFGNIFSHLF